MLKEKSSTLHDHERITYSQSYREESFGRDPTGHFRHARVQCPSSPATPTMYARFFSHSPCCAHVMHWSFSSSHVPLGNAILCPEFTAPTCIHFVALHFTLDPRTGHPACVLFWSSVPVFGKEKVQYCISRCMDNSYQLRDKTVCLDLGKPQ